MNPNSVLLKNLKELWLKFLDENLYFVSIQVSGNDLILPKNTLGLKSWNCVLYSGEQWSLLQLS